MPSRVSQREAIRDNEKTDVPSLPLLAIRGFLCYRCLEHSDSLVRCGGCKRAAYCSIECQLLDWHISHKLHCKPFQRVNAIEEAEASSDDEQSWEDYTTALHRKAQVAKSCTAQDQPGDLVQAVIGQPYCSTCYRSYTQLVPHTELVPCNDCSLVFTCSDCECLHTPDECRHYRLLGDIERYKLRCFEADSTITAIETTSSPRAARNTKPLSASKGWLDYYRRLRTRSDIDDFIATDFTFDASAAYVNVEECRRIWLHLLLATDSMSVPLTILAALEESVPRIAKMDTLELHLVGAAGKEFRNLNLFEELLHLLPALRHLKVVLIGPESPGESAGQTGDVGQEIDLGCCAACTSQGRQRTVTSFQGGYHDFAQRPAYAKPHLAVLFHSGRSQANIESWKPTTRFLVDSGTRTLCTTYTEREAMEEAAELHELGARLLIPPEVNKWRGLAPLPELLEGPEHGAYYNNYYRYIFHGLEA